MGVQRTLSAETATAAVKNAFRLRSDKAYSQIALNVEKRLQVFLRWLTLSKHEKYCKSSSSLYRSHRLRINRKFYAASVKDDADLMQHLTHMTSVAE